MCSHSLADLRISENLNSRSYCILILEVQCHCNSEKRINLKLCQRPLGTSTNVFSRVLAMVSWKPFFTADCIDKLIDEIPDHPQAAGRGGIKCPENLQQKAGYRSCDTT